MFSHSTESWIAKIAKVNKCSREDVVRYLNNLSSKKKVLSHLQLASCGEKVLSHQ